LIIIDSLVFDDELPLSLDRSILSCIAGIAKRRVNRW